MASFDLDTPPRRLAYSAAVARVFRYDPEAAETHQLMPNIACDEITYREGATPPSARFRYVMDDTAAVRGWPTEFETIIALAESPPPARNRKGKLNYARYVLRPGDRVVVVVYTDRAPPQYLFHGFASNPQANAARDGQEVTFTAHGVAISLWDRPVAARYQKDASAPNGAKGEQYVYPIDGPVRFNPNNLPNCTPPALINESDANAEGTKFDWPLFYEAATNQLDADRDPVFWTLPRFVRYLCLAHNAEESEVLNPSFSQCDGLLRSRRPANVTDADPDSESPYFDATKEAQYTYKQIYLNDFDMTGMEWPVAMERQLAFHGFAFKFQTTTSDSGPVDSMLVYRKDAGGPFAPKQVSYQPRFSDLDPSASQVARLDVSRDFTGAYSGIILDTYPDLYEVTVVLKPFFELYEGDPEAAATFNWSVVQNDKDPEKRNKYRLYVANEDGTVPGLIPLDLSGVWPSDPAYKSDDPMALGYSRRPRPGKRELASKGTDGKFLKASLRISRDWEGEAPCLHDGTGTWQKVSDASWQLLPTNLGVFLTCENLEHWAIGADKAAGVEKSPTVRVISSLNNLSGEGENKPFHLALTCTIEADTRAIPEMGPRKTTALRRPRYRYLDAKSAFQCRYRHISSEHWDAEEGRRVSLRVNALVDHTADATWYARQAQAATQDPSLGGPIEIPYITDAFEVGDRISKINGRDMNLQVNIGTSKGEAPVYPFVVGVTYRFAEGSQATTLELADYRSNPDDPNSRRK